MAVIGTLGKIVFQVSRKQVKTLNNIQWSGSAQYATHNRHLKRALPEFTGNDLDKMSFSIQLSAFLGVNPFNELIRLDNCRISGEVLRLMIGGVQYGRHKWVIQSLSKTFERFDSKGGLLIAKVNVSLLEYPAR